MRFILITSGKGGTGKTLVSINLVKKLSERGIKCALMDCDLDDSNTLTMLKMEGEIGLDGEKRFIPMKYNGIEIFAMPGISGKKPVSMDGSELAEVISDAIEQSKWSSDYCVVDCPAGSSDAVRTMLLGFSDRLLGTIVVMQPAHADSAKRTIEFFQIEGIPVLGLIENMQSFKCSKCNEKHSIFGKSMLDEVAKEYDVEPLGQIPLSMEIKRGLDEGHPFLSGNLAKPIERAADVVIAAKPIEPGLIERIRQRAKGFARGTLMDLMAGIVGIINTEVDIAGYQKAYAFPGGKTIELDVTDRSMRKVNAQMFFRIEGGLLKVVKNPKHIDQEIRVWDRAFVWSVLGEKPIGDRKVPYDFMTGWLLGEIKYFGTVGSTQLAVSFFRDVWKDLSVKVHTNKRLLGMLEKLA